MVGPQEQLFTEQEEPWDDGADGADDSALNASSEPRAASNYRRPVERVDGPGHRRLFATESARTSD